MKKGRHRYPTVGKPLKLYVVTILLLAVMGVFYFIRKQPDIETRNRPPEENTYVSDQLQAGYNGAFSFQGEKIVHLDLKGAPPKVSYYADLFPLLSKLGATGVLIEYEDMFPYSGPILGNVSALNAYTHDDIKLINKVAKENNLKIIPLIQTFGHMEFILKLSDFKEYREVPSNPQVVCPSRESTLDMLEDMIDQILLAHPYSEIIHIGADEVYYLGICERCTDTMTKYNLTKNLLFLLHINRMMNIMNKKYPHIRVMMWDDQFRSVTESELSTAHVSRRIEPVVWRYTKDVYEELGPSLWNLYSNHFPRVWAASAFKGATGSNRIVSDATHYLQNHRSWLSLIAEYNNRVINFEGIIITGWQRYDHFAVLCELLPVGIPTLAMTLRLLLGYTDSPLRPPTEVAKILRCEQPYALIGPMFGSPKCSYPGASILEYVLHLQQLKQEFETILEDSRIQGWLTDYNIAHAFSNPSYVESATSSLSKIRAELEQINEDIGKAMSEVYDKFTVEEWRETYVTPFQKKVEAMWDARRVIMSRESWPRRPLLDEV